MMGKATSFFIKFFFILSSEEPSWQKMKTLKEK